MKDCAYYQELISRLIDRELSAEEGEELAAHARGCAECRAAYEAFAALSDALGGELEEPPEALRENVMAELRRSELWKKNRKPRRMRRVAALAAAAVLVIGLGALTLPRLLARRSAASEAVLYSSAAAEAPAAPAPAPEAVGAAADKAARYDGAASDENAFAREEPIAVSEDFAAPAQDTTKSEAEMIYEAIARSEESETRAEVVDVTGQGRGRNIAALLVGTPGELPAGATPDRRFQLRFDVDGVSSQVLVSVYGEKVFYISLSGEESDMMLSDYGWSTLRARIYN